MLELQFNPFPVIATERLLLRAVEATDLDALYELRTNNDVMLHLNKPRQSKEDVAKMIEHIQNDHQNNDAITWGISKKDNVRLMGTIGFWRIDKAHYRAEIGYMLHPDHRRKGYLNEAISATMQYGFDQIKLHSVEGHVNPANVASIGLLQKQGFVKEAYFRENYHFNGVFLDTAIYCKVRSD